MNDEEAYEDTPKSRISLGVIALGIAVAIGSAALTSSILPLTHNNVASQTLNNPATVSAPVTQSPVATVPAAPNLPKFGSGEDD